MLSIESSPTQVNAPAGLRFFLDSADTREWRTWVPSGLFYGVTTNPLLLQRANTACTLKNLESLAEQAFVLAIQELQLQTWGETKAEQITTAQALAAIDPRVVVKVPVTRIGAEVAACLIQDGIRVTLTGVYAVHQVLTAAALGAAYAAPYLGRINDLGGTGYQDMLDMQKSIANVGSSVRVLVASIRSIEDITRLATQGLDTFTISAAIAKQWFNVEATDRAAADFETAARGL